MDQKTPEQHTGRAIDAKSAKEFTDRSGALAFFEVVKRRLADVNSWQTVAGEALANFTLVNAQGDTVQRAPREGDHIKIDVPGPGSIEGDGYDWVEVETTYAQSEVESTCYGFTVRPSSNPKTPTAETAHFYSDESTSTFIVRCDGRTVTAEVHDRNITPNTDAERTTDKVRHAVVGTMGALTFSKIQWQSLTDGLVKD